MKGMASCARAEPEQPMRTIKTVLVVDDDPGFLRAIVRRFGVLGKRGISVADGDHAVEEARLHHPELALVDVFMPRRDGISIIAELRAIDRAMTIIVMSSALDPMHAAAALTAGAVDCVDKPVEPADLIRFAEGRCGNLAHFPNRATLAQMERHCLIRALVDTKGNRSEAARQLGITRCGLQKKLRKSVGRI